MSHRFALLDLRRDRIAMTFKADDSLAAKRHVQFLLSQPSTSIAKRPHRYGLSMFVDLPAEVADQGDFTMSASAYIVDVADLKNCDPSTVGYDVDRSYMSISDPAFSDAIRTGTVH